MIYIRSLIEFTWNIRLPSNFATRNVYFQQDESYEQIRRWRASQNEGLCKLSARPKWIASRCNQEARYNVISVSRGERGRKKKREKQERPRNEFSCGARLYAVHVAATLRLSLPCYVSEKWPRDQRSVPLHEIDAATLLILHEKRHNLEWRALGEKTLKCKASQYRAALMTW